MLLLSQLIYIINNNVIRNKLNTATGYMHHANFCHPTFPNQLFLLIFCHRYVAIVTSKVVGPAVMIKNACPGPVRLLVFRFQKHNVSSLSIQKDSAFVSSFVSCSNLESCGCRAVSSNSSHHPREVFMFQFSLYVHVARCNVSFSSISDISRHASWSFVTIP